MKKNDKVTSSLALDWTRVRQNVKRKSSQNDINDNEKYDGPFCCVIITEGNTKPVGIPTKLLGNKRKRTNKFIDKRVNEKMISRSISSGTIMEGKGIICMVEDSTWFQGYFVPLKKKIEKPIGFLATTSIEKDGSYACCSCEQEDGYRIMDIQLFGTQLTQQKQQKQDKLRIICRGGDYLSFSSKSTTDRIITFQSQTIMTKQSSDRFYSFMKLYFQSILSKVNSSELEDELLNSCTIVIGTMKLQIPTCVQ